MFIYGKTATNGIAVMGYLALVAPRRAASDEIGRARKISPVLSAKLLTQLSGAGLVAGQPGPGGGYTLAREAGEIRLLEIVTLFSEVDETVECPFGADGCGVAGRCPLHDEYCGLMVGIRAFLQNTRLSVFQAGGAGLPGFSQPGEDGLPRAGRGQMTSWVNVRKSTNKKLIL